MSWRMKGEPQPKIKTFTGEPLTGSRRRLAVIVRDLDFQVFAAWLRRTHWLRWRSILADEQKMVEAVRRFRASDSRTTWPFDAAFHKAINRRAS